MDDTLIERLEAASEGSRELDCEIGVAIGRFFTRPNKGWPDRLDYCRHEPGGGTTSPGNGFDQMVPQYTASLDAAMTLVRKGERRVEFGTNEDGSAWAYLCLDDGMGHDTSGPNEATAVAAAALRAQAGEKS